MHHFHSCYFFSQLNFLILNLNTSVLFDYIRECVSYILPQRLCRPLVLVHLLSHPNHSSAVMAFLANQLHQVAAVDDAAAVNPLQFAGIAYSNTSVSTG